MSWYLYVIVIAAGFLAGFVNTLAGSGSLVTLPALILAGLPANVANGTNRVAVVLQNLVAVHGFRSQRLLNFREASLFAVPTILGAIAGAQIAVSLDEATMRRAIGLVMLLLLPSLIINPKRWIEGHGETQTARRQLLQFGALFLVGVYGGFIQAGVGIFLLATLVLGSGLDLIRANGVKNLIVLLFTVPALAIFALNHQVNLQLGLLLAIGNMAGAWSATRFAMLPGAAVWVHRLLIVVVLSSGLQLIF